MAADNGGGSGGGGGGALTLEQELTQSRNELAIARGQATAAAADLARVQAELGTVRTQFDALSSSVDGLRGERDSARSERDSSLGRVASLESDLASARQNVGRLEALCGVRGVSATHVVPPLSEQPTTGGDDYTAQRTKLVAEMKKETDPRQKNRIANQLRTLDAAQKK